MKSGLTIGWKRVKFEIRKVGGLKTAIIDPVTFKQDAEWSNHDPDHDSMNLRNDLQRNLISGPESECQITLIISRNPNYHRLTFW